MTVKECYEIIGNYDEAIQRLGTEERIRKYLGKFQMDQSFDAFCTALKNQDFQQAFVHIHNLKGLYLNLSLSKVGASASALCEALRGGTVHGDISNLFETVTRDHEQTVAAVRQLLNI